MKTNSVNTVFFSPTGTTARTVGAIAGGISAAATRTVDLTPPTFERALADYVPSDLTIIGAPVYAGRLPEEAVRRIRFLHGDRSPAIIVVVYGNREYDDALLELHDLSVELGFVPVAASAFVGEHSFHTPEKPIAADRPDAMDLRKARLFGRDVLDKLAGVAAISQVTLPKLPGDFPYREPKHQRDVAPVTDSSSCTVCGRCATGCPTGAIMVRSTVITNERDCILCSACIKRCPSGARHWESEGVLKAADWLSSACRERKEAQLFL